MEDPTNTRITDLIFRRACCWSFGNPFSLRFLPEDDGGAPAAAADPPVAASPVNADGTFAEDWYKDAPEPQHEYCKRFKSLADLRESSYQTKSKLGIPHEKVLQIPEEGESEAKWNDYYEKLGVPGSVEGYEFVREPDLTDRAQVDEK